MKKKLSIVCGAAMLAGLLAASTSTSALAQANFTLRWGHYLAAGPFLEIEESFARKVGERTKGRVKFNITYSGGLGSGTEVLALTGRGGIDMAAVVPGYYPDQLLYWKALQIPFVFDSPGQAIEVMQASMKEIPAFTAEMDKMRVHFLFQQPLGSFYLTGPSPNCDTLAGIAGKKIRAFGADIPKVVSAAGAVPLTIAVIEIYEALQRGTLDYSFLNVGNIAANRLYEVGKTTCGPIMSLGGHMLVMNKRTWDRMPPDIQAIINEEAVIAQKEYIAWQERNDQETIEAIKAAGGTVKPFSEEGMAKWKAATPDLLQVWVDDMTKRGEGENAAKVADLWRKMTAK
ncbi:C4-dicarboxylate TRAP transporter substrate-binding protein [Bradyrhizobium sp. LHD-71]|uniref:C4-dicarboxylate TRAP transporter substrate-binding protein n=1 Tax=Bradyrhizobium sp. LHD-71 TaxID=3072141 RepID=UPI00280F9A47|nr:C4-dicarboxylate TRAP transporter substrate-binding protein [Bradyrhizobium sp. LHD-71]MDQ8729285.1 C4-dicarboxylate TRAP transporter substrate-binding protein [Bradyrhizobium sp. LHD-71]